MTMILVFEDGRWVEWARDEDRDWLVHQANAGLPYGAAFRVVEAGPPFLAYPGRSVADDDARDQRPLLARG